MDPRDETVTVLTLHEGEYVEHGVFARGDSASSPLFDGVSVDVGAVFDEGLSGRLAKRDAL